MAIGFGPGPLGLLAVLVVLTAVSARLLGIRLRWWHVVVAGFPGLVIGVIFIWALTGGGRRPRSLPVPAVLPAALVATMFIAVLLQLLARPGRLADVNGRLRARRLPHPVRSLRARIGRTRRYVEVTGIAGRHGLAGFAGAARPARGMGALAAGGQVRDGGGAAVAGGAAGAGGGQLARSLRAALEEGGGIFVKLGQVLSTRSDMLPVGMIAELSGLQDDVPAVPAADIEALLASALGAPVRQVFAWFDPEPLASGMIFMPKQYPRELRERAVRLVMERRGEYETEYGAIRSVAAMPGIATPETLRQWVRRPRSTPGSGRG